MRLGYVKGELCMFLRYCDDESGVVLFFGFHGMPYERSFVDFISGGFCVMERDK